MTSSFHNRGRHLDARVFTTKSQGEAHGSPSGVMTQIVIPWEASDSRGLSYRWGLPHDPTGEPVHTNALEQIK